MSHENIYIAILLAALATYFSRASGVFFSKKIHLDSKLFTLIRYISVGVIVAIISRIILFPKGILSESLDWTRYFSVFILVTSYFLLKKNVILSSILACVVFYICLKLIN